MFRFWLLLSVPIHAYSECSAFKIYLLVSIGRSLRVALEAASYSASPMSSSEAISPMLSSTNTM
ncbi:hypothetical protein PF005_g9578 [Phytophthora fragariae]|uniref:RxLR effector protein n=1 Tax=Phytophthora fragariae TaxID=53985 RepID=A0A6A3YAT8_9STRA|nr:hypothetical protein PF003_g21706 [Phytophthora fragariae]KAE8943935.1 hypothetical protein PF009_g6361 [Phytophthora fragariae]KAE9013791.1 hypothetical protein PF011_g8328 [Phytophthora fragariae]KAE9126382.1 hypothetical protein PF007_g6000 [Phytophthora fragariae]KAE9126621.1 hypothetical protein PF010_g5216 [Phytophthora fragariae]